MVSLLKTALSKSARRGTRPTRHRGHVESLETRSLLSATTWPGLTDPLIEVDSNNTLDAAQDVGLVSRTKSAEFVGAIGDADEDTSDDVDWFRFTLAAAGRVQIRSLPNADDATSPVVLTLYGDQLAEFDPAVPLQHRLLGRQESHSEESAQPVDLRLSAGTYFVSISGAGNRFFHPFVADSGVSGEATRYGVRISVTSGSAPTGNHDPFAPLPELGRSGNDIPQTANDLGDLTAIPHFQLSGIIGDDRFYDLTSDDPFAMNPAADVDLFRFTITGDGTFGLIAESFAGRIGSPLDPALTLFRTDDAGTLQFVATNNNSLNPIESTNGQVPFFSDAVLFTGLSAGEYFLAVSSSGNDAEYGPDGVFDPQVAHSGLNGGTVGNYVVDLSVYADNVAPRVVGQVLNLPGLVDVDLTNGQVENLPHAPTHLSLQFSESVNVQQLALSSFQQVGQNTVRAVFMEAADGTRYFPRFESYDSATATARFLMLDGLPNGDFEFHVSGALGLTDLAGNPLNEFVREFTVADASRVAVPTQIANESDNDSFATAQDLGVIFPHDVQSGVKLVRDVATNAAQPADSGDFFRFELLQSKSYFFTLSNFGEATLPTIELLNAAGQVTSLLSLPDGQGLFGFLRAGEYVLHLGPWDMASASNVTYLVTMKFGAAAENPTPLTNGAAAAVGIRLAGHGPAAFNAPIQVRSVSTTVTPSSTPSTPPGLNDNLAALPLGLPTNSALAASSTPNDHRIVRLFGFSDRDRLFSMIDSILSRPSAEPLSVTKAELTDAELADLLETRNNVTSNDNTESNGSDEPSASEDSADSDVESKNQSESPVTSEATTDKPAVTQPLTRRANDPRRPARRPQSKVRPMDEPPNHAAVSPLAIAWASSMAITLREQARREKESDRESVRA